MQAVLQDPAGRGDGTVPVSSASALDAQGPPVSGVHPGDRAVTVEHQPAYENVQAQRYTVQAIIALCRQHYQAEVIRLAIFHRHIKDQHRHE
jgi:hypothetical protein